MKPLYGGGFVKPWYIGGFTKPQGICAKSMQTYTHYGAFFSRDMEDGSQSPHTEELCKAPRVFMKQPYKEGFAKSLEAFWSVQSEGPSNAFKDFMGQPYRRALQSLHTEGLCKVATGFKKSLYRRGKAIRGFMKPPYRGGFAKTISKKLREAPVDAFEALSKCVGISVVLHEAPGGFGGALQSP